MRAATALQWVEMVPRWVASALIEWHSRPKILPPPPPSRAILSVSISTWPRIRLSHSPGCVHHSNHFKHFKRPFKSSRSPLFTGNTSRSQQSCEEPLVKLTSAPSRSGSGHGRRNAYAWIILKRASTADVAQGRVPARRRTYMVCQPTKRITTGHQAHTA